jgi:hypothetical protein
VSLVAHGRTTPILVRGDKAYSSGGNRHLLRRRGIKTVIPEPSDQAGHGRRPGPQAPADQLRPVGNRGRTRGPENSARHRTASENAPQMTLPLSGCDGAPCSCDVEDTTQKTHDSPVMQWCDVARPAG